MSEERRKQIAPAVVLAMQGNKNACRDVYIYYHKSVFFICRLFTGDATVASELTVGIFRKVFESIQQLEDHTVFEQWLYAYVVNVCRKNGTVSRADLADADKLAATARGNAESRNTAAFNKNMSDLVKLVLEAMPLTAKVAMCYEYFAGLDAGKISILEKISEDEAAEMLIDADKYLDSAAERLCKSGVELSPFLENLESTLYYLASKAVVYESVHKQVSELAGVNVNPLDAPAKPVKEQKEPPRKVAPPEEKKEAEKKVIFTKKDLIYFAVVLIVAVCLFSGVKMFYEAKQNETTTISASAGKPKPVLVWNGAAASSFEAGSGTKEDPYIIASGGQLAYLANLVNDGNSYYASCHYRLGADIKLNVPDNWEEWDTFKPENEWTPIGYRKDADTFSYFSGTFDGADHTIYGMYVNQTDEYAGLFGVVRNAHIKNLNMAQSYVAGGSYSGGIAGYFSGDASDLPGFEYCSFNGRVVSSGNNAGGITGYFSSDGDATTIVLTDCCVFGSVSAEIGFAGGICGANEAISGNSKIVNCFNAAEVTAKKNAGGISGNNRCADAISTVEKCYNSGVVTAEANGGALVGLLSCVDGQGRASVIASFSADGCAQATAFRAEENERLINMNNTVLSAEQMTAAESFSGFNFEDIWEFRSDIGYKYPVLRGVLCSYPENTENETT